MIQRYIEYLVNTLDLYINKPEILLTPLEKAEIFIALSPIVVIAVILINWRNK